MVFAETEYLWTLAGVPALLVLYAISFSARRKALYRFARTGLLERLAAQVSRRKRRWKAFLVTLALMCVVFSLARPQSGGRMRTVQTRGTDIVFCLDTSYSMLAEDVKPNRLTRAKREIARIVDELSGDRVGLIVFAGDAFLQCPLTTDYGTFLMLLDETDTDAVPEPGTSLGTAIDLAVASLERVESDYRIAVCFTDGEDFLTDPVSAAEKAGDRNVQIFTVAVGGAQGVPIPLKDVDGRLAYKKDKKGQTVFTNVHADVLNRIASETGGVFAHLRSDGSDLSPVVDALRDLKRRHLGESRTLVRDERFQYPLAAAFLLLMVETLLSDRQSEKRRWLGRFM